jgi:hypothetical protein
MLPCVIDYIKGRGYAFVTLDQLPAPKELPSDQEYSARATSEAPVSQVWTLLTPAASSLASHLYADV